MSPATLIGILLVMVLIIGVSWFSGRKVADAKDFFSGGGKAGPLIVCGKEFRIAMYQCNVGIP